MTTPSSTPPWIYINGYPGVGKHTVALALERTLRQRGFRHPVRVYHTHLLIDPIGAIVDRDAPEYGTLRSELVSSNRKEKKKKKTVS